MQRKKKDKKLGEIWWKKQVRSWSNCAQNCSGFETWSYEFFIWTRYEKCSIASEPDPEGFGL